MLSERWKITSTYKTLLHNNIFLQIYLCFFFLLTITKLYVHRCVIYMSLLIFNSDLWNTLFNIFTNNNLLQLIDFYSIFFFIFMFGFCLNFIFYNEIDCSNISFYLIIIIIIILSDTCIDLFSFWMIADFQILIKVFSLQFILFSFV